MSLIGVNGTTLYHEVRGQGPPFLIISATPGESAYYTPVAEALADELTVVTYDRRGDLAQPRPAEPGQHGRARTGRRRRRTAGSTGPRAAAAFGLKSAAAFLADLKLRRPDLLTGAIFHEPPAADAVSDPDAVSTCSSYQPGAGSIRRYTAVMAWRNVAPESSGPSVVALAAAPGRSDRLRDAKVRVGDLELPDVEQLE